MKKIILIVTLLLINIIFIIHKINNNTYGINLKLDKNELGIMTLNINNNRLLLLTLNNKKILYLLEYNSKNNLMDSLNKLNTNIDYIVMNNNYNINFNYKKVINKKLTLNNIEFNKNKIIYNKQVICLNKNKNCDYIIDINNPTIKIK